MLLVVAEEIKTPSHPVNLAVFRIAVFSAFLRVLYDDNTLLYSRLPREYLLPPEGWADILPYIPLGPSAAITAKFALAVFCVAGLVGFFSRFSALAATLLGIYVLGIPNFFGKINHVHFLLWFFRPLGGRAIG